MTVPNYFGADVAARTTAHLPVEPVVDALAELAGAGRILPPMPTSKGRSTLAASSFRASRRHGRAGSWPETERPSQQCLAL